MKPDCPAHTDNRSYYQVIHALFFVFTLVLGQVCATVFSNTAFSAPTLEIEGTTGSSEAGDAMTEEREPVLRQESLQQLDSASQQATESHEGYTSEPKPGGAPRFSADIQEKARARLLFLYKFKQMGYALPLLSVNEPHSYLEAQHISAELLRSDAKTLSEFQKNIAETATTLQQSHQIKSIPQE